MIELSFKKTGYDPFLDYLKGLCMICVILTHGMTPEIQKACAFSFWGGFAVPVLLTISIFHYLKKPRTFCWEYFKKIIKRIILPFCVVQSLLVVKIVLEYIMGSGRLSSPLIEMVKHGGAGPGSYFVSVYLQFTLLVLPLFQRILRSKNSSHFVITISLILISIFTELVSNWLSIPLFVHRLTCLPYLFLLYYGYKLSIGSIIITNKQCIFALLSATTIYILNYTNVVLSPFVYMQTARDFHIYCYPFMMYSFIAFSFASYFKIATIRGGGTPL